MPVNDVSEVCEKYVSTHKPIDCELVGDVWRHVWKVCQSVKVQFVQVVGQHYSISVMAFLFHHLAEYLDKLFTHSGFKFNAWRRGRGVMITTTMQGRNDAGGGARWSRGCGAMITTTMQLALIAECRWMHCKM